MKARSPQGFMASMVYTNGRHSAAATTTKPTMRTFWVLHCQTGSFPVRKALQRGLDVARQPLKLLLEFMHPTKGREHKNRILNGNSSIFISTHILSACHIRLRRSSVSRRNCETLFFSHILRQDCTITVRERKEPKEQHSNPDDSNNILAVCKELYLNGVKMLWAGNTCAFETIKVMEGFLVISHPETKQSLVSITIGERI